MLTNSGEDNSNQMMTMPQSEKSSLWQRRQKKLAKQAGPDEEQKNVPSVKMMDAAPLMKKILDGGESSLESEAKRAVAALVQAHSPTRA